MGYNIKGIDVCRNPWKEKCKNSDIQVYIYYNDNCLPLCRKCWGKIAEKDLDW